MLEIFSERILRYLFVPYSERAINECLTLTIIYFCLLSCLLTNTLSLPDESISVILLAYSPQL